MILLLSLLAYIDLVLLCGVGVFKLIGMPAEAVMKHDTMWIVAMFATLGLSSSIISILGMIFK